MEEEETEAGEVGEGAGGRGGGPEGLFETEEPQLNVFPAQLL